MSARRFLNVGVVGCGNIVIVYLANLAVLDGVQVRAVADIRPDVARAVATAHRVEAMSVDALLAAADIDVVLNLTPPVEHAAVTRAALAAGKHVYCEKPLATVLSDAREVVTMARARGLALGCAPDTVFGASARTARALLDAGAIGTPVAGAAFTLSRGMEHWHPNPAFFFQRGGGPVMDMGPYYLGALVNLLGPVVRVQSMTTTARAQRKYAAASGAGVIDVQVPTTALALLEFEGGATATFGASWDVTGHRLPPLEIYGVKGALMLPDPNYFGGAVEQVGSDGTRVVHTCDDVALGVPNWPPEAPEHANYRGVGVLDLCQAVMHGRPPSASGDLALHLVEVMLAITDPGQPGRATRIGSQPDRPPPVDIDALFADELPPSWQA